MAETLVPDTSVLVDGRITELLAEDHPGATVVVPMAALAELEAQANKGLETGFAGLNELQALQNLAKTGDCSVTFSGQRPSSDDIEQAATGAIDAMIRDVAVDLDGLFVTSDRVQAYAAAAQGLRHHYIRPVVDEERDLSQLEVMRYFEDDIMSVHLKADCQPMVKRGTPAGVSYEESPHGVTDHQDVRRIARECIEYAKRDYDSFIELERHGCTVCQIGPMRTTIAQPPFSDALEITAVRPVFKATIADYDLPEGIMQRIEEKSRGVFVAGPPGSGKSTFAAAVAEHLHGLDRVVKTMEQPRDLQVPKEVTQYGALDRDMQWTGEVMLLVRPDHVVYDEVRTTNDFTVFADMRLAGIGLYGVTHASRPIDAVQRLIGRVDLGMIPQIVDTIIYIDKGSVATVLELRFTVKVPEGITSEDLARPVVIVKDIGQDKDVFELYSFGEQVVVMPLDQVAGDGASRGASALAERELRRALRKFADGPMDIQVKGNTAIIYVEQYAVPQLIGKGGRTVQGLEARLGMKLDVRSRDDMPPSARSPQSGMPRTPRAAQDQVQPDGTIVPRAVKKTGSNIFVVLGPGLGGREYEIRIGDAVVGAGRASNHGKIRFKAGSPEGKAIAQADSAGMDLVVTPLE